MVMRPVVGDLLVARDIEVHRVVPEDPQRAVRLRDDAGDAVEAVLSAWRLQRLPGMTNELDAAVVLTAVRLAREARPCVRVVAADLGSHAGRGRSLLDVELQDWSAWVQAPEKNGIANKSAFAASKIRMGFTVGDISPDFINRASREREQQLSIVQIADAEEVAEKLYSERIRQADSLIASLNAEARRDLRAQALSDPAAIIGRNVSPSIFERLVTATERRLVLNRVE